MKVFDYVNAINNGADIVNDNDELTPSDAIREYVPFITNRALSYHPDSIQAAQLMNLNAQLSSKMQFDFLISTVRPRSRYAKWVKPQPNPDLDAVIAYFRCNRNIAKQYLAVLSEQDITEIKNKLQKGGGDG